MGELAKLIGCRREETAREMPRPLACAAKWMVIQLTEVGNVGGEWEMWMRPLGHA